MIWFLAYFSPDNGDMTATEAAGYGIGFVLMTVAFTLVHHIFFFNLERTGMRARVAMCAVIYRKVRNSFTQ